MAEHRGYPLWTRTASLSGETASGQKTSVDDRTAEHRSLPFGTLVRADNQESRQSAIVRVTDRGPFGSGRIIDLITDHRT
ncbi:MULTISPECIES: RlpA-like double-psi beta-barrel domain-containing protein [unclassified Bradyrhizobium]|uniref:RlpA-like double-psi beta-barrel domain-containing protein n=1 Tax=unclassified Bradyrhizobium TaxID=2631580 RepID=UPI003514059B